MRGICHGIQRRYPWHRHKYCVKNGLIAHLFLAKKNRSLSPAITRFCTKKTMLWIHNPVFSPKE